MQSRRLNQGASVAIGVGIGAAIGVAIDNIAVGVGVGVAIGAAIGAAIGNDPKVPEAPNEPERVANPEQQGDQK